MMFNRLTNLLLGNLRKQLMVGMAVVIASMMTLFVWSHTRRNVAEETKRHELQETVLAESVATSSAIWVNSRDYSGLQEVVSSITRYPNLRYFIVLDARGQVLAHSDPSKIGLYLAVLPQQQDQTALIQTTTLDEVISPITFAGAPIGWVRLGIDRAYLNDEVAQLQRDGLVFTLIGTLLSILIAVLASRYLTRRLTAIQQVADAVNAGQTTARVILSGDDEAARLARQFNGMLDSLALREAALKESEERFRRIFEHSSSVMLLIDPATGTIVEGNRTAVDYYGYSKERLADLSINDINTLPAELVAEERQRALHEERNYFIFQHRLASGEIRDVEVHSTPIESSGRMLLYSIVHDITARKQAEEKLRASEQEFHSLAESMPQIVWITRPDGWNIYFNQQWVDYTGLTLEESYGHGWILPFHPEDQQRAWDAWQQATQHYATYSLECRLRRADGAYRWWLIRGVPLRSPSGAILKWFGTCTDIEAIKQTAAALQASEEQYRLLLQYLPVGVVVYAPDTKVLLANSVATLLLGLSWEQMQGKGAVDPTWCFVREDGHPLPVAEYPVSRVVATGQPVEGILLGIDRPASVPSGAEPTGRGEQPDRPGGSNRVWVLANAFPQFDDAGKMRQVEVTFIDLTARKKLEEIQHFLAKTSRSHADESFFEELARYLSQSLGMFYVCIDRLEGDGLNATTLAIWCDSHFEDNTTYALKDTPCGDVVGNQVCCFPASVCQLFPRDQVLQDLCAESYIGVTLFSHSGQPIGLIAVIGRAPLADRPLAESILKLVAIRAAGELERLFAEENLQLSASVFSHSREGILITEADGTIVKVNEAFTRITGYSSEEVAGKNPRLLSSGHQSKEFYALFWHELSEKGYWSGEFCNRRKNGEVYAELLTVSAVRNTEGKTQHYVALFSDISALKEHEHQLEHIAHFDTLTNLPNRVLLADRLHQGMTQVQRRNQILAVVFLDLDGFKTINDDHGHAIGDQLLRQVAARMQQALREGDTLARMGGDEFVAVILDLIDIESSIPILNRLLAAAAEPVQVGSLVLQVSASLGTTFHPQSQDIDADQLLRQADQAMYQAKISGKNRYQLFGTNLDSHLHLHYENSPGAHEARTGSA
ncbi:MAG: PAS domain S-box protein [Chromatiaceae bacterium]